MDTTMLEKQKMKGYEDMNNYKLFTKWIQCNVEDIDIMSGENIKIELIKSKLLYAGFPEKFNDCFDTQLRLSKINIDKLADDIFITFNYSHNPLYNGSHYNKKVLSHEIEMHSLQMSCLNISCFSSLNPMKFESHKMWGIYGKNGAGFAIQYNVHEISQIMCSNQNSEMIDVCYTDNLQQLNALEIIKAIFCYAYNKETSKATETIKTFLTTKHKVWENEKEWRFINVNNYDLIEKYKQDIFKQSGELDINKIKEKISETKKNNKKIFNFIKPRTIVFGWNAFSEDCNNKDIIDSYKDFIKWCKSNNVEIKCLKNEFDYSSEEYGCKIRS
jgi:hypothetical protein